MLFAVLAAAAVAAAPSLPETPKKPIVREYHGVKVTDDYQWLENDADPAVAKWSEAQNAVARAFLDRIPGREALARRIDQLVRSTSVSYHGLVDRRGVLFAVKSDPSRQQPSIVVLPDTEHPEGARTVLDPNVLDPGGHTAVDFWSASLDGKKIAVSLSKNGSEEGDLHVYEVATGRELDGVVPHVNNGTAGGSVAWNADGSGFWYTRYPRGSERPPEDAGFYQQIWFHKIGTPTEKDRYELGKELPRIAEIALESSEDGRWILAEVKNGDGGDAAFFLRLPKGKWTCISRFEDRVVAGTLGRDGAAYLLSRKDAPMGKILRMELKSPRLELAKTVVPEGDGAILEYLPTSRRLLVADLLGGPTRVREYPLKGGAPKEVKTPDVSTAAGLVPLEGGDVLMNVQSFVSPPAWYRLGEGGEPSKTALATTSIADYSDCEVVRDLAVSKDGTRIPVNIVRRKGTRLDGRNPTVLWGYGGYGVSETPSFSPVRRAWIEAGGVFVLANLRGGGEYGDAWHKAGNLVRKQNVFDDFFAAARYLSEKGYADRDHLVILGGSNGGLLMGAALVQHPELWKAVVSLVGIYDMLRVEETPNGGFNVTEFGTVKDPEQFRALHAYSPYHHVEDGKAYPPVLFLTGANDPRVDPWQSRKMTARLQAAGAQRVLLRTSTSSGHGVGSALDEIIAQRVDVYSFFLGALGVEYRAPQASAGP